MASANLSIVKLDEGREVCLSYGVPVAAFIPGRGDIRTAEKYSVTTSTHANGYAGHTSEVVPAAEFATLIAPISCRREGTAEDWRSEAHTRAPGKGEANARLFAAAPDLLALLRDVQQAIRLLLVSQDMPELGRAIQFCGKRDEEITALLQRIEGE